MSLFKKLFGSKESKNLSKDQSNAANQADKLETYRSVPWMTSLRLDNIEICINAGFRPASSLPTELERQLRPKLEIAKRLNAIKAMVLWLMVAEDDLPNERILYFIENNGLNNFMTIEEKEIFNTSRHDEELRNAIGWKFENAWPLAWYFGYDEPEIFGDMITGEQMQQIVMDYTCPLDEKIEDWIANKEGVTEEEVIIKEDLFYCIHNAVRSAQHGKETVPSTFDPMINGGAIHERRHSLTWMLSDGVERDETDLST